MIETYIVDSFTDKPFHGNPAGVCLVEHELQDHQMLSIAKELGLSETAFVCKTDGTNRYTIRFFSPKMEIPLCGHATLASSKVLFEKDENCEKIHFTNIDELDLLITRDGEAIIMEFPVYQTELVDAPPAVVQGLGLGNVNNAAYNRETNILLLEIADSAILITLKPDFQALYRSHSGINGVLVTAPSSRAGFDFESRYFWPWSGSNEDPVTGGTHTFLARYWSDRLGKSKMHSFQCSERGGFMEVELLSENKMTIKSQAQIIFSGKLNF